MSFHVRVFEHGEWVERAVDINHYVSRNREEPKRRADQRLPEPAKSPTVGFLTRTIYRSPTIRWVLPANILPRYDLKTDDSAADENLHVDPSSDVIFVGDDFVHLKRIDPDTGQLRHLGTKADFNSRIRAAKVFGEAKKKRTNTKASNDDHFLIKKEVDDNDDFEKRLQSTIPGIPEQLIVLTMESQDLVFLSAYKSGHGKFRFSTSTIPLPNPKSLLSKPGKHLAVDPRSRAIAVGAAAGLLVIYNAKPLKQTIDDPTSRKKRRHPILDDKVIPVEGMILKMEFLCPLPKDENHVILVLVISKDERGWLQCYEWDDSSGFRNLRRHSRQPLMTLERMPLMLIPFSKSPNFLLVTEHSLTVIENTLTESLTRRSIKLPYRRESLNRAGLPKFPLLTSWARPVGGADSSRECIYLCREDGAVYYLQIADRKIGDIVRSGNLKTRIGVAFANLGMPLNFPDTLICAGDLCTGGLFSVIPWSKKLKEEEDLEFSRERTTLAIRQQQEKPVSTADMMNFQQFESIPNWSPTFDLLITNLKRDGKNRDRYSIFTTSGRTPYGAITELRYGYEARIGGYFLDQPEISSATGLWTIRDITMSGIYLLLSMPHRTSLLHISSDLSSVEIDIDEYDCGLDFANETIAAQELSSDNFIQITRSTIVLLHLKNTSGAFERKYFQEIQSDSTITAALVEKSAGLIATAIVTEHGNILSLRKFTDNNGHIRLEEIGQTFNIRREATCITSFIIQNCHFVCVGTAAATLEIYRIEQGLGLTPILEHKINSPSSAKSHTHGSDTAAGICESMIALHYSPLVSDGFQSDTVVACGLRNGDIYCVELNHKNSHDRVEQGALFEGITYSVEVGYTSANLIADTFKPGTAAFVTCGSDTFYLTCRCSRDGGLLLSNICFTDSNEPSYLQGAISVIARFPVAGLSDALICSSGSRFLVCQLGESKQPVHRRIPVEGNPNRLLYASHLNAMVVASLVSAPKTAECLGTSKQKDDKPSLSGLLQFISINGAKDIFDEDHILGKHRSFDVNERIYALTEWKYKDDTGKEYYFIVLGTGIASKNSLSTNGRVYLLRPWPSREGEIKVIPHKTWDFREGPVYAIAFQGQNCMLVTAGKSVLRFQYSSSTKRWDKLRGTQLTSPGARIAVSGSYAHVATSLDSLQSFSFEPPSQPGTHSAAYVELGRVCSDGQARNSAGVLPITFDRDSCFSDHSSNNLDANAIEPTEIILLSDKAGSIAGLHFAPNKRVANAAPLLFEATFSRSIIVLRRGRIRPPWQRPIFKTTHHNQHHQHNERQNERARCKEQQKPQGVLVDDIVGSATDGTIISGTVVDEHAWRLLSFLTRACAALTQLSNTRFPNDNDKSQSSSRAARGIAGGTSSTHPKDADARYSKPLSRSIDVDIDPDNDVAGLRRKLAYHVNGDILARIIYQGEEEDGGVKVSAEEDPVQALIDAIDGRMRSNEDDTASECEIGNLRDDIRGSGHVDPAESKLKKEYDEKVRDIRKTRWRRFDELVRKALPGALEEDANTGVDMDMDMAKEKGWHDEKTNEEVTHRSGERGEGDVSAIGQSGRVKEGDEEEEGEEEADDDDEYNDGAMDIEQAQFEMEVRLQIEREKGVDGDEEEKAQKRERRKLVGAVVDWLREVLMPLP